MRWGVWSDRCFEVDGFSSVDGLEGQHRHLESDAGSNRKRVEVTEGGGGHMGALHVTKVYSLLPGSLLLKETCNYAEHNSSPLAVSW